MQSAPQQRHAPKPSMRSCAVPASLCATLCANLIHHFVGSLRIIVLQWPSQALYHVKVEPPQEELLLRDQLQQQRLQIASPRLCCSQLPCTSRRVRFTCSSRFRRAISRWGAVTGIVMPSEVVYLITSGRSREFCQQPRIQQLSRRAQVLRCVRAATMTFEDGQWYCCMFCQRQLAIGMRASRTKLCHRAVGTAGTSSWCSPAA